LPEKVNTYQFILVILQEFIWRCVLAKKIVLFNKLL